MNRYVLFVCTRPQELPTTEMFTTYLRKMKNSVSVVRIRHVKYANHSFIKFFIITREKTETHPRRPMCRWTSVVSSCCHLVICSIYTSVKWSQTTLVRSTDMYVHPRAPQLLKYTRIYSSVSLALPYLHNTEIFTLDNALDSRFVEFHQITLFQCRACLRYFSGSTATLTGIINHAWHW